jgi:hypothetical protein
MHEKYAKDGLSVVSVSLDEGATDPDVQADVRKWLEPKNAQGFTNLLLEEKPEFWQAKLRFDGPPAVYVFNRDGRWFKFEGKEMATQLDRLIPDLLKAR